MKAKDSKNEHPWPKVSRRHFLSSVGVFSAGAMLGGCSKNNTTEPAPPVDEAPSSATVAVGEVKMYDKNVLKNKVAEMLDKLGGLGDLIKPGDTVGLKINLTGGDASAQGWKHDTGVNAIDSYWTHPLVVNAIGELCKDAGAGRLVIIESIYDWKSINNYGFNQIADMLGAEIYDTNQAKPYSEFARREVGSKSFIYNSIYQNKLFEDFDCFISLPKAKQHVSAGVTHAMKNLVGSLPQPKYQQNGSGHRAAIHNHTSELDKNSNSNLARVVLDINSATKIHLAVNDAIKTTIGGEGPWCQTMRNMSFDRLVISKDVVAADTISTQVIGFDPWAADYTDTFALPSTPCINYLREAQKIGLGVHDQDKIELIEV